MGSKFEIPVKSRSLSMRNLVRVRFRSVALFFKALFQFFWGFLKRGLDMRSSQPF